VSEWTSNHDHVFGQDVTTANELKTTVVVVLTVVTMAVEIGAGMAYGSMALLADGLHMSSHALALGIAVFAYRYARRYAADPRYSFGTGKVNALAGYSGAVLLGLFVLGMAGESLARLVAPVAIAIDQALLVAVLGLVVNGASAAILGVHSDDDDHEHDDRDHDDHHHHHHDHNLRSAYLHVVADALTSVLAIVALLVAKYHDQLWLDPVMGLVGAVLVARWSVGLLRDTARVLLDRQAPRAVVDAVRTAIETDGDAAVVDSHVWSIGPGKLSAIVAIEADDPRDLTEYRSRLPARLGLTHLSIEVGRRRPRD